MKHKRQPKHVILGVTGSIAAYKAAELVRLMKIRGWDVSVIMTRSATEFVGELTFRTLSQNPVGVEMFDKTVEWIPDHISLADRADVFAIAPCTANVMAKLAHGIADDLLTCTALACAKPLVVAPAMNEKMWDHPATQENVRILKKRGVRIVNVGTGDLACGVKGRGRLADLNAIMEAVAGCLNKRRKEKGK
jgi:phosphopantothenoylcysteine decarboxylase/phosphopantothenate--cysteine ligase